MQSSKTYSIGIREALGVRFKAYSALVKVRLSLLVVFSALFGFLMAPTVVGFDPMTLLLLASGGFLVTGASNTLNQVMEVEFDRVMSRTKTRPLVTGVITPLEAVGFALVCGTGGILILGLAFGLVAALLGIIALLSYAFVYTPLKRLTSISVMVGAFPGAAPALIGWAAATGTLGGEAWILFLVQFIWQFPHFWAIGWLLDDDYKQAGFKMLPGDAGRSAYTASMTLIYTALLIPVSLLPLAFGLAGPVSFGILVFGGVGMTWQAWRLLRNLNAKEASRLMFGSFLYLPMVQIAMLVDKF